MSKRRKPSNPLKSEVEHQTTRLRAVADEIDRHADERGALGFRAAATERAWATLIREIADNLTRVVNQERPDAAAVGLINKVSVGIIGSLMFFAPTANAVATQAISDFVLPEAVAEKAEDALQGAEQLDIVIVNATASTSETELESVDDAERSEDDRRLRDLAVEVASQLNSHLTDAMESAVGQGEADIPWVEVHDNDVAGTFRVVLHSEDWAEPVEVLLEASANGLGEVITLVEAWVDRTTLDIQHERAGDQQVQQEIDRIRGK